MHISPMTPSHADGLDNHPIAIVSQRTGLTQDVLRVWERRYGAVNPARGPGGQRVYTSADIERLRLLQAATRAGRSIGQVAQLCIATLSQLLEEDSAAHELRAPAPAGALDVGLLIATGLAFTKAHEPALLNDHLRRAVVSVGIAAFLEDVAVPLLRRVGEEWHAGRLSIAQEHLASSVLHDIIVSVMRSFAPRDDAPRVLVATPAGERHAIGAALVGASAAVHGWHVVYLGADLPASDIAAAAAATDVDVVALSILYVDDMDRVLGEVRDVRALVPATVAVLAGGSGASRLATELTSSGVTVGASIADLGEELRRRDRRGR